MEAEGRQLQKEVNEYQMLLSALTKAEKQKEQFQEKLEQSAKETADAQTALERSRVMLESLEGSKDYQNQQEAQAAYAKADTAKKEKDVLVMRAEERLQKAQEQENRAQTLIAKYKKKSLSRWKSRRSDSRLTGKFWKKNIFRKRPGRN